MITNEEMCAIHELGFCCFEHLADYYFFLGSNTDPTSVRVVTCADTRKERIRENERAMEDSRIIDHEMETRNTKTTRKHHVRAIFNRRKLPIDQKNDPHKFHLTGQALLDAVDRHQSGSSV